MLHWSSIEDAKIHNVVDASTMGSSSCGHELSNVRCIPIEARESGKRYVLSLLRPDGYGARETTGMKCLLLPCHPAYLCLEPTVASKV